MTPEIATYRDNAAEALAEAHAVMTLPLPKAGARSAYYAAFHAAEALLLTRTGRITKTHTSLRSAPDASQSVVAIGTENMQSHFSH